tara:strand:- start:91 stop:396 length:306 start_codon:yes stop_codon:yes gene_type:complete
MHKVVINTCFGGFGLSPLARDMLVDARGGDWGDYDEWDYPRHCPHLVRIVEELGPRANGRCADLDTQTLRGNKYRIEEYDGREWVEQPDDPVSWIEIETGG